MLKNRREYPPFFLEKGRRNSRKSLISMIIPDNSGFFERINRVVSERGRMFFPSCQFSSSAISFLGPPLAKPANCTLLHPITSYCTLKIFGTLVRRLRRLRRARQLERES